MPPVKRTSPSMSNSSFHEKRQRLRESDSIRLKRLQRYLLHAVLAGAFFKRGSEGYCNYLAALKIPSRGAGAKPWAMKIHGRARRRDGHRLSWEKALPQWGSCNNLTGISGCEEARHIAS
jgi:hypothetical protein